MPCASRCTGRGGGWTVTATRCSPTRGGAVAPDGGGCHPPRAGGGGSATSPRSAMPAASAAGLGDPVGRELVARVLGGRLGRIVLHDDRRYRLCRVPERSRQIRAVD